MLVLGWLFGLPVPFMIIWAPSWGWVIAANALLGINQGLAWSMTVIMKIDLVGPKSRGLAVGLNEFAGYLAVGVTAFLTGYLARATVCAPCRSISASATRFSGCGNSGGCRTGACGDGPGAARQAGGAAPGGSGGGERTRMGLAIMPQQLGQADQIVGRGRQRELPADALLAAMPGAPLQGDLLDPAEAFLDPLADALAHRVAGMAGGPPVDRRAAVAGVLGDVRGDLELAQCGDEAGRVEALVAADGDRVPARQSAIIACATSRSAVPLASLTRPSTSSPWRFSISAWPMKQSLASLPLPLR